MSDLFAIPTQLRSWHGHTWPCTAVIGTGVHTAFAPHIITPIHRKLRIPSTKHSWEAFNPVVWNEEKSEFI